MAWEGYWTYDGNEIINASRVEAYAKHEGLGWFKPVYRNADLPVMLGEHYANPTQDDAPWSDPDFDASSGFWGLYPLDVAGVEDSTRVTSVTESVGDGGVAGRIRHATKSIVFNGILLGASDESCDYGMMWLRQALLGGGCGGGQQGCGGADLCYLSASPLMLDSTPGSLDPEECLTPYVRTLREVVFTSGPSVTAKRVLSDGSSVWTVQFTAVAGVPWEFGAAVPVIERFMDPDVVTPWAGGEVPDGGFIDLDGIIFDETDCAPKVYAPVFDPSCPTVSPPPAPPNVALGCYVEPANWRRRQITIPKQYIPLWNSVVPVIDVHAPVDVRNLRLRFYADVLGDGSVEDDPCAYCGDILISYIPESHTLTFDAATRAVYLLSPGGVRRRADNLVFATDGGPFDWPVLSCGFGYIVTVDLPQQQTPPSMDLSLIARAS